MRIIIMRIHVDHPKQTPHGNNKWVYMYSMNIQNTNWVFYDVIKNHTIWNAHTVKLHTTLQSICDANDALKQPLEIIHLRSLRQK